MTPTLAPDRLAEAARAYAHAAAALVAHNAAEPYEWDYRVSSRWQDAHRQWFRQWRTIVGTERLARAAACGRTSAAIIGTGRSSPSRRAPPA
jgi:hypothetical protein